VPAAAKITPGRECSPKSRGMHPKSDMDVKPDLCAQTKELFTPHSMKKFVEADGPARHIGMEDESAGVPFCIRFHQSVRI